MFTKPLHSRFFNLGQVIETYRGRGIFQPAVDEAVKLLQSGEWVRQSFTPHLRKDKDNG
jgi:monolysocardiolipin acyltransferase